MSQPSLENEGAVECYYRDGGHCNEHGFKFIGTNILVVLEYAKFSTHNEGSSPEIYGMCCPWLIVEYMGLPVEAQYTIMAMSMPVHTTEENMGTIQ